MSFNRKRLRCGAHFNSLHTFKYKKNYLCISFIIPHNIATAAHSSLLPDVLTRATEFHPSLKDIERELDDCYGAQLSSYSSVRSESKIMSLSMETLDDHYTIGSDGLFARTCRLLGEVIFSPLLVDGVFDSDIVASEKEKLLASIARRNNSKRHYALDKCKELMYDGEPYGVFSYGSVESVISIGPVDLYDFYQYLLKEAKVEIFYVGSQSEDKVEEIIENMFSLRRFDNSSNIICSAPRSVDKIKYFSEDADYKQSVLVMGCRTQINTDTEEKYAFTLFNSIFGSGVNSKLFKIVREKMHLCYYASCSPELTKGVAFISSGIDSKNEEITKNAIIEQLRATVDGDFTDADMQDCKKALKNAYKELSDSPEGLCGWYLGKVMFGDMDTIENVVEKIEAVTRQGIIDVASKMQLDTVFMLRGIAKNTSADGGDSDE